MTALSAEMPPSRLKPVLWVLDWVIRGVRPCKRAGLIPQRQVIQGFIHQGLDHLHQVHHGKRQIPLAALEAIAEFVSRCRGATQQFRGMDQRLFKADAFVCPEESRFCGGCSEVC